MVFEMMEKDDVAEYRHQRQEVLEESDTGDRRTWTVGPPGQQFHWDGLQILPHVIG